ncbi:MAG: hypothetical protein U0838_00755 [Chloroflexota bacterium]
MRATVVRLLGEHLVCPARRSETGEMSPAPAAATGLLEGTSWGLDELLGRHSVHDLQLDAKRSGDWKVADRLIRLTAARPSTVAVG